MNNILIIAGPSGAGKSTVVSFILDKFDCHYSISTTSRERREGEIDGKDYYFVSKDKFEQMIIDGKFLEYELVHSNYYGTTKDSINNALADNKLVLFDIDVKGHDSIKRHYPFAKSVFLTVESKHILKERLLGRSKDSSIDISNRLNNALFEIEYVKSFDYIVINDNIDDTKEAFFNIIKSMNFLNHSDRSIKIIENFTKD